MWRQSLKRNLKTSTLRRENLLPASLLLQKKSCMDMSAGRLLSFSWAHWEANMSFYFSASGNLSWRGIPGVSVSHHSASGLPQSWSLPFSYLSVYSAILVTQVMINLFSFVVYVLITLRASRTTNSWLFDYILGSMLRSTDTECSHTLLKMWILAFLPINPCSST